jgi:tRNA(Ile)-lysidine synthase
MLHIEVLTQKNLLAFSGGVDSTALFFLLLEQNIPFDIAIVNYNTRKQSKQEIVYALSLALQYKKQCFIHDVTLEHANFEYTARQVRYEFFEEIIKEYGYETLLTAHQLNDKLEWFLMQLSKGAGLSELIGLNETLNKNNYTIFRPLLNHSKKSLEEYLQSKQLKYFYDESNNDITYTRNYFRQEFANVFLDKFENGVKKSFEYLQDDLLSLNIPFKALYQNKGLEVFKNHFDNNINIRIIDNALKKRGYLLSSKQRQEVLKQKECVIGSFVIAMTSSHIFIAPYIKTVMPKIFKELCRKYKIPQKIRAYLFEEQFDILMFSQFE